MARHHYSYLLSYWVSGITLVFFTNATGATEAADSFFKPAPSEYMRLAQASKQGFRNSFGTTGMDNDQLRQHVEDIRSRGMSYEQRNLNYQWLDYENYTDDMHLGARVVTEILKMGFKNYWRDVKQESFSENDLVPTESGSGTVGDILDYRVRLTGNKLDLSLEYGF